MAGMLRVCLLLSVLAALNTALASASVQKIGDNLYAYVSSNDASSNSVFLIGENGILVVDTGRSGREGTRLLEEIRKISPLPVRWIVNTHFHQDHRGGNRVVGPDAIIISTVFTRERALRVDGQKPVPDYALNEIVGQDGVTLYVGEHPVHIYASGPAHTRGDLVVYFPDQHAIATGDLFLNNSCPYMDDGDLENWIAALNRMLALPLDHVVPGHFAVGRKSDLEHFRNYLADSRNQVRQMWEQGRSLQYVQQHLDMSSYKDLRQFPQFEATFADNAAAYYHQLEQDKQRAPGSTE
jgi:cyclase